MKKEYTPKEIKSEQKNNQSADCKSCKKRLEFFIGKAEIKVGNKKILFKELPYLFCKKCEEYYLNRQSKYRVKWIYNKMVERKHNIFETKYKTEEKALPFCEGFNISYDVRDYKYIPGLDEFLTPCFFDKEALVCFSALDKYELIWTSNTYGRIRGKTKNIDIAFGVNSNNALIMWLGDLDKLDEDTLNILKSTNQESDHTLMKSQFYSAQICAEFTEPTDEMKIINSRNNLYKIIEDKYDLNLHHLEENTVNIINKIKKPANFREEKFKDIIDNFYKVIYEDFDTSAFKGKFNDDPYFDEFIKEQDLGENGLEDKSIKCYHFLLSKLLDQPSNSEQINDLMCGFYLLGDLRHYCFHNKATKHRKNILEVCDIKSIEDNREFVYEFLLDKLKKGLNKIENEVS